MKRRDNINKALKASQYYIIVSEMTTEITETLEVSLSNYLLNKEIKATNMLKHNPKVFFQYVRSKRKTLDSIGPLINTQNELVINDPR